MTNDFKNKQSSGARPPRLSPEEYAAKKKAEKEAIYQLLDNTASEVVQSPEKFKAYHIALDDYEHGVVIRSLNDKKTDLKKEGKSTDAVDELIIKIGHAPRRKFKVVEKESCRESR